MFQVLITLVYFVEVVVQNSVHLYLMKSHATVVSRETVVVQQWMSIWTLLLRQSDRDTCSHSVSIFLPILCFFFNVLSATFSSLLPLFIHEVTYFFRFQALKSSHICIIREKSSQLTRISMVCKAVKVNKFAVFGKSRKI